MKKEDKIRAIKWYISHYYMNTKTNYSEVADLKELEEIYTYYKTIADMETK